MDDKEYKIAFVTNIPSPYRVYYFDKLAEVLGEKMMVIYCARSEYNRSWNLPEINHNARFLTERSPSIFGKRIYLQKEVTKVLSSFDPDLVITGGFNPTMLYAIAYCWWNKITHAINTDAWELNESSYKWYHILIRKIVYARAKWFFPISSKGRDNLIKNYRINPVRICVIPYVINQDPFIQFSGVKKFDLLFSGQFIDRKMPLFFAKVCRLLAEKLSRKVTVAVIGNGPMKDEFMAALQNPMIDLNYPGFVQQNEISTIFCSSKYYLFPSKEDGWGVVANEAVAAGIPCITCDNVGAAGDIIQHEKNGLILELDEHLWVDKIAELEADTIQYQSLVDSSKSFSKAYSAELIVKRFIDFIHA